MSPLKPCSGVHRRMREIDCRSSGDLRRQVLGCLVHGECSSAQIARAVRSPVQRVHAILVRLLETERVARCDAGWRLA